MILTVPSSVGSTSHDHERTVANPVRQGDLITPYAVMELEQQRVQWEGQ